MPCSQSDGCNDVSSPLHHGLLAASHVVCVAYRRRVHCRLCLALERDDWLWRPTCRYLFSAFRMCSCVCTAEVGGTGRVPCGKLSRMLFMLHRPCCLCLHGAGAWSRRR